jgi:hypothetical protein
MESLEEKLKDLHDRVHRGSYPKALTPKVRLPDLEWPDPIPPDIGFGDKRKVVLTEHPGR